MRLFHIVAVPLNGDTIDHQKADGDSQEEYLFAANSKVLSACYAIPLGGKLAVDVDTDGRITMLIPDSTLDSWSQLNAKMYSFPAKGFSEHPTKTGEWISDKPVSLRSAKLEQTITSLNDIMQYGVQIFAIPVSDEARRDAIIDSPHFSEVDRDLEVGRARWLNEETGINPVYRTARCATTIPPAAAPQPKM
jgi:hypothetical protein